MFLVDKPTFNNAQIYFLFDLFIIRVIRTDNMLQTILNIFRW